MRREVSCDGADGFGVHAGGSGHHIQVVLVGEVEEEDVVCLAVDAVSYGVWLVGYETGEDSEVAHARDYVVPIRFAEVKMRFFSEEKHGFKFPALQGVNEFAENVFDHYLAVDGGCVAQIYDDGAALVFGFQQALVQ